MAQTTMYDLMSEYEILVSNVACGHFAATYSTTFAMLTHISELFRETVHERARWKDYYRLYTETEYKMRNLCGELETKYITNVIKKHALKYGKIDIEQVIEDIDTSNSYNIYA
jgi:hypothetical protein